MNARNLASAPRFLLTPRTWLAAPQAAHIPVRMAWAAANHAQLQHVAWWRRSADQAVAESSLAKELESLAAGEDIIFNVFERSQPGEPCRPDAAHDAYVGRIDLHSWDFDAPRCEIGYMADVRTSGRGLLREAALACVQLAFDLGAVRVEAMTDPHNLRSIRFAKALGMAQEGLMRNYERDADGKLCDQVLLAIVLPN